MGFAYQHRRVLLQEPDLPHGSSWDTFTTLAICLKADIYIAVCDYLKHFPSVDASYATGYSKRRKTSEDLSELSKCSCYYSPQPLYVQITPTYSLPVSVEIRDDT